MMDFLSMVGFSIKFEFVIFAVTLLGVAFFHNKTMYVALSGLGAVLIYKWFNYTGFSLAEHIIGNTHHEGEWRGLLNLIGLLFGFSILAKHFEDSKVPERIQHILPSGWWGGFLLLVFVLISSSFLDNIAAAMIGGTIAMVVYKGKVHIGYLAAIIAASNAGGSGSVVGDTTTTLMWIDGVAPQHLVPAFIGAGFAFLSFGVIATYQQHKYNPIDKGEYVEHKVDMGRLSIVLLILVLTIITNWKFDFPALGVWTAILVGSLFRKTPWQELRKVWKGTVFLVALVTCASLMPVTSLPAASWKTTFFWGFVSAVFDNIPLTKLCLSQGGYDWGILAYAVGFGGSMVWFGSSAGVALASLYPDTKSVRKYLFKGWHIPIAYGIGFFVMFSIVGWNLHPHKQDHISAEKLHEKAKVHKVSLQKEIKVKAKHS